MGWSSWMWVLYPYIHSQNLTSRSFGRDRSKLTATCYRGVKSNCFIFFFSCISKIAFLSYIILFPLGDVGDANKSGSIVEAEAQITFPHTTYSQLLATRHWVLCPGDATLQSLGQRAL